jgi:hypothetical protein
MAMTLSLVIGGDFVSDVKLLSLLANTAGFALKRGGYLPGMALDGRVSDVLTVDVIGTSHNDLATKLIALEDYFQRARWAGETPERYQIWLRAQMTNETNARQSLVLGGSHGDKAGFYSPPASPGNRIVDYPIVIDRLPVWEAIAATTISLSNISSVGGHTTVGNAIDSVNPDPGIRALSHTNIVPGSVWGELSSETGVQMYDNGVGAFIDSGWTYATIDYIAGTVQIMDAGWTVAQFTYNYSIGDFPGRMGYTSLVPHSGSGALTEYWLGFRSNRLGHAANFVSPWECESGTPVFADTTAESGGLVCTFANGINMRGLFTLTPYQISSSYYEDLRGTFNIVARLKCDAGVTCLVRVIYGLGALTYTCNDAVIVTGTDWKLYDLGRVTFPCGGQVSSYYSAMKNSNIRLQAQRTAGTGTDGLHMDCLIPIPVNEGYAHIANGTGVKNELFVNPFGKISCYDYTSTDITGLADATGTNPDDYFLPTGGGIVVVAAQRAAGSTAADAVDIGLKVFPRWRTLRGAA